MTIDQILESLGLKTPAVVAGILGATASLTYERDISPGRALLLILVGSACAAYITPLIAHYFTFEAPVDNAVAFMVGLLSMRIVGGLLVIGEKFKDDPMAFIRKIRNNDTGA
jgi:hypothetical protein